MERYGAKRFSDPVHGTMGFSELEVEIIDSRVFQRLRNIRHLGLVHYVFPGADFSRFSHSLGVCHLTGRMLDSLRSVGHTIDEAKFRDFRLAGLLHDIGHYPFSHPLEQAISDFYRLEDVTREEESGNSGAEETGGRKSRFYKHAEVSELTLSEDVELREIFSRNNVDPGEISKYFVSDTVADLGNLISSDLDADRLDYLIRVAHYTGLPYGHVDLEYLLSQLRVDARNQICLHKKALRTVDHFLLSRYFQYQQVILHKSVVIFERVLKDVIWSLLDKEQLDLSRDSIKKMMGDGTWYMVEDTYIYSKLQKFSTECQDEIVRNKLRVILERKPPKLLASEEFLGKRDERKYYSQLKRIAEEKMGNWATKFSVPLDFWYVESSEMPLTSIGSRVPASIVAEDSEEEEKELRQAVWILNDDRSGSTQISEVSNSLMSNLASQALYSIRVYAILPPDKEAEAQSIADSVQQDLSPS